MKRSDAPYIATIVGLAVSYFVAAKFGLTLAFATRQVTAVWPPTGIALVGLLLFGYRVWPGVYLGALLANALSDEPLAVAAGIAAGNTLAGLGGAFLLRRAGFDAALKRTRDVLTLALTAAVSTILSASGGVASLALGGLIPWSGYRSVWWVWWIGDTLGILVVAPLLLAWAAKPRLGWRGWRLAEIAALLIALVLAGHGVFSAKLANTTSRYQLEYAAFPFLIWAALRFGLRETVSAATMVSGLAIWGAVHDSGPFATGTLDQRLILLDTFVAVIEVTALLLGAVTAERQESRDRLHRAHDELDLRVRERTRDLAQANAELRAVNDQLGRRTAEAARKSEEVEAFVYIVSHDLRAPLVNLQGFSKELQASCQELQSKLRTASLPAVIEKEIDTILEEGISGSLRFISASTTRFQRLIDALLLLSRSGRQEYRSDEVDVQALVSTIVDSLRQSIEESGALVDIDALPAARGDITAIGQVFGNLIGNAVKYRHRGRALRIGVGGEANNGMAHYWVHDNGAGFPPSAQRRLFQVFQRFHPDVATGEGIGLAIVKRVVERHGGKVWAESREGEGTTFHLTLPSAGVGAPAGAARLRAAGASARPP